MLYRIYEDKTNKRIATSENIEKIINKFINIMKIRYFISTDFCCWIQDSSNNIYYLYFENNIKLKRYIISKIKHAFPKAIDVKTFYRFYDLKNYE